MFYKRIHLISTTNNLIKRSGTHKAISRSDLEEHYWMIRTVKIGRKKDNTNINV